MPKGRHQLGGMFSPAIRSGAFHGNFNRYLRYKHPRKCVRRKIAEAGLGWKTAAGAAPGAGTTTSKQEALAVGLRACYSSNRANSVG